MQYSYSVLNVFDDTNMQPVADWHPRMEGLVYYAMDWLCPSYNKVMNAQLNKYYGKLTVEDAIRDIMPIVQSGDQHVYVADLPNKQFWFSVAGKTTGSGPINAFDRPYIHLNLTELWSVTPSVVVV